MNSARPVVVIGLGAMGSAACAHLARRGVPVIGLEQFTPVHDLGSSHGGSRLARRAYFEHPDYVPLLHRAFDGWERLKSDTGVSCLHRIGVLLLGAPESAVLSASYDSAQAHDIPVRLLDPDELVASYPQFNLSPETQGLLEPDAGFVIPENGVRAHLEVARRLGADLRFSKKVTGLEADDDGGIVHTENEAIRAQRIVVTAGAWVGKLLPSLAEQAGLEAHRKLIAWFPPRDAGLFASDRMPGWLIDDGGACGEGLYYGVPTWPGQPRPAGVKIGFHGPGLPVDPDNFDRSPDPEVVARFQHDMEKYFPGLLAPRSATMTCLYTMSPDQHFVVDRLPGAKAVVFATGFSGHGYKFAPVIGELLADLALHGQSDIPADFLQVNRFGASRGRPTG